MAVFPIRTPDQKAMMGVCISFAILPVIAVGLRLLAHRIAQKKWTPGDYLLIAACVRHPVLASVYSTDTL